MTDSGVKRPHSGGSYQFRWVLHGGWLRSEAEIAGLYSLPMESRWHGCLPILSRHVRSRTRPLRSSAFWSSRLVDFRQGMVELVREIRNSDVPADAFRRLAVIESFELNSCRFQLPIQAIAALVRGTTCSGLLY